MAPSARKWIIRAALSYCTATLRSKWAYFALLISDPGFSGRAAPSARGVQSASGVSNRWDRHMAGLMLDDPLGGVPLPIVLRIVQKMEADACALCRCIIRSTGAIL